MKRYWALTAGFRRSYAIGALALLLLGLLNLLPPAALAILIDGAGSDRVAWMAGGYVAVFLLQSLVRYPTRMGFIGTSIRAAGALRDRLGRHVLRAPRRRFGPSGMRRWRSTASGRPRSGPSRPSSLWRASRRCSPRRSSCSSARPFSRRCGEEA